MASRFEIRQIRIRPKSRSDLLRFTYPQRQVIVMLTAILAAGCLVAPPQYDVNAAMALLERARTSVRDGRFDMLQALFTQERYAGSVREIAADGRALRSLKVSAFPAPSG